MTEKRFICGLGFPINSDDPICIISDSVEDKDYYKFSDICNVLNEQHSIIRRDETSIQTMMSNMEKLEEENDQLRKELNNFKPVMFQDIRGTVILYSKGNNNE